MVLQECYENGRSYSNDSYNLPNDEAEQTRLAIAHQAFLLILVGELTVARIPRDVERILDVGTGTGDWAVAMGERYPNAKILATDISAFQPIDVPPNVFFQVDDAQEEWTYTDAFDFIHMRGLGGAFTNWNTIYAGAYKHLRPGGFLEITDFGSIHVTAQSPDSYVGVFNRACALAAKNAGILHGLEHMKKSLLERAGFRIMKTKVMEVPLGTWSSDAQKKAVGKMALISTLEGLEATSLRLLTRYLAWTVERARDLCEKVRDEVMRPDIRAFVPCHFVVARKLLGGA